MGLLGNILSGAISDGIGKAVSKAVEDKIAPAAQRWADKQAEAIDANAKAVDAATKSMEQATEELEAATNEAAAQTAAQQPVEMTPEQQEQARQASEALKGLGMIFSGAVAQAKAEAAREEEAKKAREAEIFEKWAEFLPAFPTWDVGGSEFELEEETPMNGYPAFRLHLKGRPFLVEQYAAKLRSLGFVAKGCRDPQDLNADTYYKMVDGVCHAFNRSDACNDGWITVSFYVDNYKPQPQRTEAAKTEADPIKDLAKGLFKKLF